MKKLIFPLVLLLVSAHLNCQQINKDLLTGPWTAHWITSPTAEPNEYGVFKFKKTLEFSEIPAQFIVHVSADNQYKLYVNEQLVSIGPEQGDIQHWYFRTIDLAPFFTLGKNTIVSLVWNMGKWKPEAQISHQTAFILQGSSKNEEGINTDESWVVLKDDAYQPTAVNAFGYYVAGPGEFVDRFKTKDTWSQARRLGRGAAKGVHDFSKGPWMLVPTPLPPMELKQERLLKTRFAKGMVLPQGFPEKKAAFTIPSNSMVSILLDQTHLTNAYPTLVFGKGTSAQIGLTYAEALYDQQDKKGNRNDIQGKRIFGRRDSIVSNGDDLQEFTTLSWRTYRYVQVNVKTFEEPLEMIDLYGTFIGYPFQLKSSWQTIDPELKRIYEVGWRTARLCAVDTYMDCPYYERLQYIGDTRIQAMVSYFNSGDDRLAKHAIDLLDYSRLPEGVTQSRYPATGNNIIPPFSLLWIGMLSDFYHYRPDTSFVKKHLNGSRQILTFFQNYQGADGSLKNLPYWNFTDWVNENKNWNSGVPPKGKDGVSALFDLQLLMAFQVASKLEKDLGSQVISAGYSEKASQLKNTIRNKYWDKDKGLFADRPTKDIFSQHTNILAVLTETAKDSEAKSIVEKVLSDKDLAPASIYFRYYLNLALVKAGLGDLYLKELDIWKKNLAMGMTTWAEISDVSGTRSDCHAWGSSPNIEFFRTVLGIDSDAPGFKKVKIQPHLGKLEEIVGEMPHPLGNMKVHYRLHKNLWSIEIVLPESITGTFVWKEQLYPLSPGPNQFSVK